MQEVRVWRPSLNGVQLQWCREVSQALPLHLHDSLQVGLIEEGHLEVEVCGETLEATAGQLLVFNPGEPHRLSEPSAPVTARVLELTPEVVRRAMDVEASHPVPRLPSRLDDTLGADLLRALHDALESGSTEAERFLEQLVCHLVVAHGEEAESGPPCPKLDLSSVQAHLEQHLSSIPALDELAELAGGSRFQVVRAFKRDYGLPPLAYHLQLRLSRAKALLAEGRPAAEVAFSTGFSDQSHLNRHFRRHTLLTPGAFARQVRTAPQ